MTRQEAIDAATERARMTWREHSVLIDQETRSFGWVEGHPIGPFYWVAPDGRPIVCTIRPDGSVIRP